MSDGPIKLAGENHGKERREAYAVLFEQVAKEIRESGKLPEAAHVLISWDGGSISRTTLCEPGFSVFRLIGILDAVKQTLLIPALREGM